MDILRISLFGTLQIANESWLSEAKITRKCQALMAYLLLHRHRPHPRDVLASIFWGGSSEERARGCLNTTLWQLRRMLEPDGVKRGTYILSSPQREVGFNCDSPYWLDVEVFEDTVSHILHFPVNNVDATQISDLEKVLELYKAELLEGFYEDWALQERERLSALYLKSLMYLQKYYRLNPVFEKGIMYGKQILSIDPLLEEVHCEMMKLYMENGQRALAAQQYEACRLTLAKELGISPMKETQALYELISSKVDSDRSQNNIGEPLGFDYAIREIREARQAIDTAKERINHALHLIKKYSERHD